MIISHKHKYLFIGLPFRASSGISKELVEKYDGETLYSKHANIPLLMSKKKPNFEIKEYFVFAVFRNPLEIAFTVYNKLLTNPYGTYTDPKYFIENGGFVTRRERKFFYKFQEKERCFEEFLKMKYKYYPYDDNLTMNLNYLDKQLNFQKLSEDFENTLLEIGIKPVRILPVYNKTKKIFHDSKLSESTYNNIFGPYIKHNQLPYKYDVSKISKTRLAIFPIFSRVRALKIHRYDIRQMNNTIHFQRFKK